MSEVRLDPSPTGEDEQKIFLSPDEERKRLENVRLEDENKIRLEYVRSARSLSETWVGFSIVMSLVQVTKPAGLHFETVEFIAIVATALASVIALWAIVGTGLFGRK